MPGYGPDTPTGTRRSAVVRLVGSGVLVLVLAIGTSCGFTGSDQPGRIVVPPTEPLSTEVSAPASAEYGSTASSTSANNLPQWTIGRTVTAAPRVDSQQYHRAAVTTDSPLVTSAGFHFSTPDRSVECSTGTNGRAALACDAPGTDGPAQQPASAAPTCQWSPELITLDRRRATHGACANLYPVMHRSAIVGFGYSITIDDFTCLSDSSGLYCLQTESGRGFSVTPGGYRQIESSDPAPSGLLGIDRPTGRSASTQSVPPPPTS